MNREEQIFERCLKLAHEKQELLTVCKAILAHWRMNDEKYWESTLCTDLIQAISKAEGRE